MKTVPRHKISGTMRLAKTLHMQESMESAKDKAV